MYQQLHSAQTTTGVSSAYQWFGGQATLTANGFGSSGSITLQHSPASSTGPFVTSSTDAILNAASTAGAVNFSLGVGWIRTAITVASTTGINVWVH